VALISEHVVRLGNEQSLISFATHFHSIRTTYTDTQSGGRVIDLAGGNPADGTQVCIFFISLLAALRIK
jgi:hypothetical protein